MADDREPGGGERADCGSLGLYPPRREMLGRLALTTGGAKPLAYETIIESICGTADASQPVERYDGSLGVSTEFVSRHQAPVGQLRWDDILTDRFENPGNVSGVRWGTGTLISHNLFLTAGHCFDPNPRGGWVVPRVSRTTRSISSAEIAASMHVSFNYQVNASGEPRTEFQVRIEELVEYRSGGLDMAIVRLAGNPGTRFGMGVPAIADPTERELVTIIGHPAGVPKRIEAGPVSKIAGDRIHYDTIETLGGNSGSAIWHSDSGQIVGVHTAGGCRERGGANFGVRIERIRAESPTIHRLDHGSFPLDGGVYQVRQASSDRALDGHQTTGHDFSAVTRPALDTRSQRWRFAPVGLVLKLRQHSSSRYLDAHDDLGHDYSATTRKDSDDDGQKWVAVPVPGLIATYTLQQLSTGRFLDAYLTEGADFSAMTRTGRHDDTQRWQLAPLASGACTISQVTTGRSLDAYHDGPNDFSAVTRAARDDDAQRWTAAPVGAVYEIEQVSSGRRLDAHDNQAKDFSAVTRPSAVGGGAGGAMGHGGPDGRGRDGDSQRWVATYLGGQAYTLQQLSSGRFLDAHETADNDYSAVTRTRQNHATQRWLIG